MYISILIQLYVISNRYFKKKIILAFYFIKDYMLCFNMIYLKEISSLIDKVVCEKKLKCTNRTKEIKYCFKK